MQLKICGLRSIPNIEEVLKLGPDYLGFIFYKMSARYAGREPGLANYLRSLKGIKKVGVFVDEKESDILRTVYEYGLDLVQLHGTEPPEFCKAISKRIPLIKAFGLREGFDFLGLSDYEKHCDHFLFDTYTTGYGGSGLSFNQNILERYALDKQFFLSGGIGMDQVNDIKCGRHHRMSGIDVNSRFETQPGLKDIRLLKQLKDAIRN